MWYIIVAANNGPVYIFFIHRTGSPTYYLILKLFVDRDNEVDVLWYFLSLFGSNKDNLVLIIISTWNIYRAWRRPQDIGRISGNQKYHCVTSSKTPLCTIWTATDWSTCMVPHGKQTNICNILSILVGFK